MPYGLIFCFVTLLLDIYSIDDVILMLCLAINLMTCTMHLLTVLPMKLCDCVCHRGLLVYVLMLRDQQKLWILRLEQTQRCTYPI